MHRLFIILFLAGLLAGCRSVKYIPVNSRADSIYIEKLTPTIQPGDSSTIKALIECDENGQLILKLLDIANSKNARAEFMIDSLGNVIARMNTQPDTVYIRGRTEKVTVTERVPYPVEKELTAGEDFKIRYGGWALGILALGICYRIIKFFRRFTIR